MSAERAPSNDAVLARVRAACRKLPELAETVAWGHPTFKAGKKAFAALDEYHGVRCLCFKTTIDAQRRLAQSDRYFPAPYAASHGWVCVKIDARLTAKEIRAHLVQAYRLVALQRMLKALDESANDPRLR